MGTHGRKVWPVGPNKKAPRYSTDQNSKAPGNAGREDGGRCLDRDRQLEKEHNVNRNERRHSVYRGPGPVRPTPPASA